MHGLEAKKARVFVQNPTPCPLVISASFALRTLQKSPLSTSQMWISGYCIRVLEESLMGLFIHDSTIKVKEDTFCHQC